jgi:hypothetical protein
MVVFFSFFSFFHFSMTLCSIAFSLCFRTTDALIFGVVSFHYIIITNEAVPRDVSFLFHLCILINQEVRTEQMKGKG